MKRVVIGILFVILMSLSAMAQFPEINVFTDAISDRALIKWTTTSESTASIDINNHLYVYGAKTEFSHEEEGLKSGKTYKYKIVACSESYCTTKTGTITTEGSGTNNGITGNIVIETAQESGPGIYYFLIALLGLTLVFVTYRINQPDMKITRHLSTSETFIKKGHHHKAKPHYTQALNIYKSLDKSQKTNHYHRLMRVYNHLSLHQKQLEAKSLTEKYQNGTITQQELSRLRELLTE